MSEQPKKIVGLFEVAQQIRDAHAECEASLRKSLDAALRVGDLLIEAKACIPRGEWLDWLGKHTGIADRTARGYMQLARNRTLVEQYRRPAADSDGHTSIKAVLSAIAEPRPETDPNAPFAAHLAAPTSANPHHRYTERVLNALGGDDTPISAIDVLLGLGVKYFVPHVRLEQGWGHPPDADTDARQRAERLWRMTDDELRDFGQAVLDTLGEPQLTDEQLTRLGRTLKLLAGQRHA